MKILMLVSSMHAGGAERVAATLVNAWAERGDAVTLTPTYSSKGTCFYPLSDKVELAWLADLSGTRASGAMAAFKRLLTLRRHIRDTRPDVIVSFLTNVNVAAILATRGLGIPLIVCERTNPVAETTTGTVWRKLRRLLYPRADMVTVQAEDTAGPFSRQVPGIKRLAVIPNPVHFPLPRAEPILTPITGDGRKRLLAVGRLHADKGFDLLIQAFSQLAASHPDWDLVILGEGEERRALEAQLREAGLASRVFMPGRAGNVGDWYDSADLYVLTSRFEGLSNTLLESMASGLAAVSFDCDTGPREIVRDGVDGVLVRPNGDVPALAKALDAAMGDAAERSRMAQAAIDVRDRFSAARVLQKWQELFDGVRGPGR